jgi:hypothetical protein
MPSTLRSIALRSIASTSIASPPRFECVEPWLIGRSDCNDSPPQLRLCRLDRARQAQWLIQPSKHKGNRTISARRGGVNWKMDKLTRDQTVAWRG